MSWDNQGGGGPWGGGGRGRAQGRHDRRQDLRLRQLRQDGHLRQRVLHAERRDHRVQVAARQVAGAGRGQGLDRQRLAVRRDHHRLGQGGARVLN